MQIPMAPKLKAALVLKLKFLIRMYTSAYYTATIIEMTAQNRTANGLLIVQLQGKTSIPETVLNKSVFPKRPVQPPFHQLRCWYAFWPLWLNIQKLMP